MNSTVSLICPSVGLEYDSSIGDNVPEIEAVSHTTTACFEWKEAVDSGAEVSMCDVLPTSSDITTASTATNVSCKSMDTGISTNHEEDDATGVTFISSRVSIKGDPFDISVAELEECVSVNTVSDQSQALLTSTKGKLTDCDDYSLDAKTDNFKQPWLMAPNGKEMCSIDESFAKIKLSTYNFLDINSQRVQNSDNTMFTHVHDIESADSRSEAGSLGECSRMDCSSCSCEYCHSGCGCSCSECNCSCSCEDCKSDCTCSDCSTTKTESNTDDKSSCTCEDCFTCCPSEVDSGRNKTTSNDCSLSIKCDCQCLSYTCSDGNSIAEKDVDSKAGDIDTSFDCNELASCSHGDNVSISGSSNYLCEQCCSGHDSSSDMDESTDSDCSCDYCVHAFQVRDIVSVSTLCEDSDYDGDNEL